MTNPPAQAPAPPVFSGPAEAAPAAWPPVRLRYLQRSPVRVGGPVTGNRYDFSAAQPVVAVEARDAEALVRTGFFARE